MVASDLKKSSIDVADLGSQSAKVFTADDIIDGLDFDRPVPQNLRKSATNVDLEQ